MVRSQQRADMGDANIEIRIVFLHAILRFSMMVWFNQRSEGSVALERGCGKLAVRWCRCSGPFIVSELEGNRSRPSVFA
jgi:hypothetical protein